MYWRYDAIPGSLIIQKRTEGPYDFNRLARLNFSKLKTWNFNKPINHTPTRYLDAVDLSKMSQVLPFLRILAVIMSSRPAVSLLLPTLRSIHAQSCLLHLTITTIPRDPLTPRAIPDRNILQPIRPTRRKQLPIILRRLQPLTKSLNFLHRSRKDILQSPNLIPLRQIIKNPKKAQYQAPQVFEDVSTPSTPPVQYD